MARTPTEIIAGMEVWFPYGPADSADHRTHEQYVWDQAVLACSEYIRRRQDYDEALAGELHKLLTSQRVA